MPPYAVRLPNWIYLQTCSVGTTLAYVCFCFTTEIVSRKLREIDDNIHLKANTTEMFRFGYALIPYLIVR